jgi:TRAP-type mannitol/chloroaromatic compound transport system substrate-binding protein
MLHTMINSDRWNELPAIYQSLIKTACQAANCDMMAKYDAKNPEGLKKLASAGAKFSPYSQEIMESAFKAANDTYAEFSASNAAFKKTYDSMAAFRADAYLWQQFSEYTFDTFMMGMQRKKLL